MFKAVVLDTRLLLLWTTSVQCCKDTRLLLQWTTSVQCCKDTRLLLQWTTSVQCCKDTRPFRKGFYSVKQSANLPLAARLPSSSDVFDFSLGSAATGTPKFANLSPPAVPLGGNDIVVQTSTCFSPAGKNGIIIKSMLGICCCCCCCCCFVF